MIYFFQHKGDAASVADVPAQERLLLQDLLRVPEHLLRLRAAARTPALPQHLDGHRADQDEPARESSPGPEHQRGRHAQDHQVRVQRAENVHRQLHQPQRC